MRIEPTVTLVNRVVDANGTPIPYVFTFDGERGEVTERLTVPAGIARIIVHNSMYKLGPESSNPQYRLGVPEWDMPVDPLPPDAFGDELVDRESLGWPRRTTTGKVLAKGPPLRNVTPRHDPINAGNPKGDGAFPGHYGDVADPRAS